MASLRVFSLGIAAATLLVMAGSAVRAQEMKTCTEIRDQIYFPACSSMKPGSNQSTCVNKCTQRHQSCLSTGIWQGKKKTTPAIPQ